MSKTDCQLLRQKVHQRILVMKTSTGILVVFKTKRQLKCQFSGNIVCLFSLTRFFYKLFDVIIDNPFFNVVNILHYIVK